jgi:hypothetical protein
MLVARSAPTDLFVLVPGRKFELTLRALNRLLDDDGRCQAVQADLLRRYPHTPTWGLRLRVDSTS